MDPTSIGSLIRRMREKDGLSRSELARRANINRNVLDRIEKGTHCTRLTSVYVDCIFRALDRPDIAELGLLSESDLCHNCKSYVGPWGPAIEAVDAGDWFSRFNGRDLDDPPMPFTPEMAKNILEQARALQIVSRGLLATVKTQYEGRLPPTYVSLRDQHFIERVFPHDPIQSQIQETIDALDGASEALRRCHVNPRPSDSLDEWLNEVAPPRRPVYAIEYPEVQP